MKTEFTVSTDNVLDFAQVLSENDLTNQISGYTEEGDLLIEVTYTRDQRDVIDSLEELAESDE